MARIDLTGKVGEAVFRLANAQSVDAALSPNEVDRLRAVITHGLAGEMEKVVGASGVKLLEEGSPRLNLSSVTAKKLIVRFLATPQDKQKALRDEWSQALRNKNLSSDERIPYLLAWASTNDVSK